MPELCLIAGSWGPDGGGIEQVNRDIARVFFDLGWKVRVLGTKPSTSDPQFEGKALHLTHLAFRSRFIDLCYRKLLRPLFEKILVLRMTRDADMVIFSHAYRLERFPYLLDKKPCWLWMHGIEVWGREAARVGRYAPDLQAIVGVSRYTLDLVKQACDPELHHRFIWIPNTVDTEWFRPSQDTGAVQAFSLLIVSRLVKDRPKGHDLLFSILPALSRRLDESVHLHVVGDGNDRERLVSEAKKQGLEKQVCFHGRVDDEFLRGLYQNSAVFCMPAAAGETTDGIIFGEGFGIVYLQAAACGRPVIVSSQGGAPETVLDEETGYIVDPTDPKAVEDRLFDLLSNPERSAKMGDAGRKFVEKTFSFRHFADRVSGLIETLSGENAR